MRALRILLILTVILGGLFVIVDRVAVNFAEGETADRLKASQNLTTTPEVSIKGFPFLTQVVGRELDEVEVGIDNYETATGNGAEKVRIDKLDAKMTGVSFSGNFSSATATGATGTALITYDQLLKAAPSDTTQLMPGVTARLIGLSDGGNGKMKVAVETTVRGAKQPEPVYVLSSVAVQNGTVQVQADALPTFGGVEPAENRIRAITDFQQKIDQLPGGIRLDKIEAAKDGLEIVVKGSDVKLAG